MQMYLAKSLSGNGLTVVFHEEDMDTKYMQRIAEEWNICKATEDIIINQGGFVGRPSKIKVVLDQSTGEIKVAGDVKIVAKGQLMI